MLTCALGSERMRGRHHENQFVEISDDGMQLRLLRIVGEDAQFELWRSTSPGIWLPSERCTTIRIMGCSRRNSASTGNR